MSARHLAFLPLSLACVTSPGPTPAATASHPGPHEMSAHTHGPHGGHGGHHRFTDPASWVERFENPARDAWQKPDVLVASLALKPDARVADVGAGTGYFVVRLSPVVPQGKVFAVDVEPEMVKFIADRAAKAGLANVVPVLAAFDDARLPEPVDVVLIVDTAHHIEGRTAWFTKLKATLRPGGRVVVVDFKMGDFDIGPPDSMKLPADALKTELEAAGFTEVSRDEATYPYQYVSTFTVR